MKYYQMCVAATCACENIDDCLCAGLGAYVHACAANGVIVRNWRKDICNKPCANTQVFENEMTVCNRTCKSLSEYDYTCGVKDVPVYGCGCPEGKYMDNNGACIDKSDCSCYIGELVIKKGQSVTLNGGTCTCENGKPYCSTVITTTSPGCLNGKVYYDCTNSVLNKKIYEKRCRSRIIPRSNSQCVPGCVCPDELVEDDSGRCIAPEECPCLFGGESHTAGSTIQRDCNKCTCKVGLWHCSTNPCPKTCQVHGDGQYVTFDGKRYMFDGNCEYIFVEDHCNQEDGTFQILTESVPCCENGVTCSRNIKILLAGKEFILTDGRVVRADKSGQTQCKDDSHSLHTVGLYLILTFPNGITVIWDKRTRVSITLDPRWKNKVCGLCGNFNDDVADDLTTKGNSLVTNAVKFGNSWKSSLSCSNTMNQTFPCDRNPYCLVWAQRKCSIMKDAIFQKCHKKVDPTPYYDTCVQEACACDLEGKYLGFCTAVAVYAEACNKAGVCIDWRTPERCPVYCDYYNAAGECSWHYQPCGTLTTKTCADHYFGKKYSAVLEGCYARCPESAPFLDENKMKCVNVSECTCYYKGKILQPDQTTMNDCEKCKCKNGKVICIVMTTTTSTTTFRVEETTTTTTTGETTGSTASTTTEETTTTTTTGETTGSTASTTTETTPPIVIPTTTTSTTSSTTETTPPIVIPTTTTSTTSSTTEEACHGTWSPWFNKHTPSLDSPGDSELLDPIRDELCPSSSDAINNIQCQFVDDPEWPVSESTDNVTCDKDTGLVCIVTEEALEDRKFCYDYKIRVCCEPQIITEWTTTSLPITTTTTTIPETTPPIVIPTTTTSTTSSTTGKYTTVTTTTTQPISTTTTESTTKVVTKPTTEPFTTPGKYTTVTTTTTQPISTTTTEMFCNGEWSHWFNENTPSIHNKGDSELLEPIRNVLCPFSPYKISDIDCKAVKFPQSPISETKDNVTCDINKGLICNYSEQIPENHFMCLDYRIRVCCEPTLTTQMTSTTTISEANHTIYEPLITHATVKPLEKCYCNSNPPRKCMETWKVNCTTITCVKGDIFKMDRVVCPPSIKPTCKNDIEPVKIRTENGCCEKWECDCECEVWGDPHYRTFGGLSYDFFENCTYTLVEEQVPKYNFSVLIDNYFCLPSIKKSCPKGLVISYNGNVVHISTGETYALTVNGNKVSLPYNSKGFNIDKLDISTYISIPHIRTSITAFRNAFKIRVPEQYFFNNTQGQCGSCSHTPAQCTRKTGSVEPPDCCHKTAYDWRVDDPNKPYCRSAPTNLPCTPLPPPPTCKTEKTVCDIISEKPFEQCRLKINLDKYVKACIFDHCQLDSTVDCSSLEAAVMACASVGICVEWRPFTNGQCNYTCNQGLVYKPCQSKRDDQCENRVAIIGATFTPAVEGCFCPNGTILSEDTSKCVASCEVCHDYLGHPKKEGDTWHDAQDPCIAYTCSEFGVLIRNKSCNQDETCPEAQRIYIDRCCFKCASTQGSCKIIAVNETVRKGNCETTVEVKQCRGYCSSVTRYDFKRNLMNHECQCCHEYRTEKMLVKLRCKGGNTKTIKYIAIKSCTCKDCGKGK